MNSRPHESAVAHVTGAAKYTLDFLEPQGMLVAYPVQAPYAHARVKKLNFSAALEIDGVVHVLTEADIRGETHIGAIVHDEALFPKLIEHYGQAVCWVLAESESAARAGANAIQVEYDVLEPILGIAAAEKAEAFLTDEFCMTRGDAKTNLETSQYRLAGEVFVGAQDHFYLETQVSLALLDENQQVIIHCSTQHPTEVQTLVAKVLDLPRAQVTVQCLRMGGGFGGKETQAAMYACIAALGVQMTGKAVRVRLNRHQDMQLTGKRHPMLARFDVGYNQAGKLEALQLQILSDGGCALDLSEAILLRAMFHADNCYNIPNIVVTGRVVKTNTVSHTAFRGFGGPQGMVFIEDILARVALNLGKPAHEVRALNFYPLENAITHYAQPIPDVRIHRIWQELLETSQFEHRLHDIETLNSSHPFLHRGIAITPVKFGISFTTTFLNQAGALVNIYADGSVQLNHGGTEMGQGLHSKMQSIAAQTLGISHDRVRIMPTSTDKVPNTSATAASSGADLNGAAVRNACQALKERLAEVAARVLGVPSEDIRFVNNQAFALQKPSEGISWEKLISKAYLERVSLSSTGFFRTPDIHFDKVLGRGEPFRYFAWGACVSEVELDTLTGMWHLNRVDILHDCGQSLNPLLDKGQIEGGFVQGMGWLTMEEMVWDDTGRLRTFAPSTYKIPTLHDVPHDFRVTLLENASHEAAVLGSKAVGEPPFMLAIAVREALRHAISSLGNGTVDVALLAPSTPEVLLEAIENMKMHSSEIGIVKE